MSHPHPNVQAGHPHPQPYPNHPQPNSGVAANLSRPATLIVTLGLAVLTAAISVVDQILFLTGGRDAVMASFGTLNDSMGVDLGDVLGDEFMNSQIDDAVSSLTTRAYVAVVFVALLLVFALFAGRIWANVLATIMAVLVVVISLIELADIGSGAMNGLAGLTALLSIAVLVMVWMGPNRRYVKAKAMRAA